ncbi:g635 [Coccomyxa elongata]
MQWFDLSPGASQEDIRREYKRLAKLHHPDRSDPRDRTRATREFQDISDAYTRLMKSGCHCPSLSNDLFEGIKSACFSRFPSPTVAGLLCTLEELYRGGLKGFEWTAPGCVPQRIQVLLPQGTRHATKLLVPGAVEAAGSVKSDLLLIVIQTRHPVFDRRADDLYTSIKVSRDEALGGWTRPLTLLDGSLLHVEHGPTSDSQARVVIPGAGMPSDPPHRRGDLIVVFDVVPHPLKDLTCSPQTS